MLEGLNILLDMDSMLDHIWIIDFEIIISPGKYIIESSISWMYFSLDSWVSFLDILMTLGSSSVRILCSSDLQLAGKDIIQLKSNSFPRGLVTLEDIFDSNDVARSPKVAPRDDEVEECNIGTEEDPKVIKISKNLTQESKERYIKLMKEFYDVFTWSYDDLKVYNLGVIQHTIPVQRNVKPFKKELIRMNPLLLLLIEKET